MIILAILMSIFVIGLFCWLLFTLAVFALPLFVGVSAGTWALHTGAGWLGAIVVGLVAAGLTFGLGQMLLVAVKPTWERAIVAAAFVAPALFAGYHAIHGVVQHLVPSGAWQTVFSVTGAMAVGATALVRLLGMVTTSPVRALPKSDRHRQRGTRGHGGLAFSFVGMSVRGVDLIATWCRGVSLR